MADEKQERKPRFGHALQLIESPVVHHHQDSNLTSVLHHHQHGEGNEGVEALGFRDGNYHDCPEFQKHEEATNIELFYDLFFAANLSVFSGDHHVTNTEELELYLQYFCMLWFTWALVGLFDVRFVTDSIFERLARAVHLGVMVGFAVVAPNFNPKDRGAKQSAFVAMSIILMISRLALVVQYTTITWHVRKYRKALLPLMAMASINVMSAFVYLGIALGLKPRDGRGYMVWYVVGGLEVALTAGLSLLCDVLSFEGTHLINRMSLLTFIIIGEGVAVVCSCITLIVKQQEAWTSPTVGTVAAAMSMLYIIYQIYFDWMRHLHLPRLRQLSWAMLHFPFHLSLTLLVEGSAHLALWAKVFEVLVWGTNEFKDALVKMGTESAITTTKAFSEQLHAIVDRIFDLYPATRQHTLLAIEDVFEKLETIPDAWWTRAWNATDPSTKVFNAAQTELVQTILNSLLAAFEIEPFEASMEPTKGEQDIEQALIWMRNSVRFPTVFYYSFVAAGSVVLLLNILYIISRTKRWKGWNYFRAVFNTLLGIGLCLVTLISHGARGEAYKQSAWVLPTICFAFLVVLVINHLPHPPPILFRR